MADSVGKELIKRNLINQDQVDAAEAEHQKSGEPIGKILVRKKFVREEDLTRALAEQYHLPFIQFGKFITIPT